MLHEERGECPPDAGRRYAATGGRIPPTGWLAVLRAYLAVTVVAHLAWETVHLPLYALWATATLGEKAFAVLHCTGGDLLIALSALILALVLVGDRAWRATGLRRVAALTIIFGLAYTIFSEWLNTVVRGAWAYSDLMPIARLAGLEVGLSPLLQWVAVPLLAFACVLSSTANATERKEARP